MRQYAFTGLIKIEFPAHTLRLCDGGVIVWGAETFTSADPVFGTIGEVSELEEGVGQMVPELDLVFHPPGSVSAADLSQPGFQRSRTRLWLALYDPATGAVVGTPSLEFDGQVDLTTLVWGLGARDLETKIVPAAEVLFGGNLGNSLNAAFHTSVWPGETGEDQATGLSRPVAWGVEAQPGAAGVSGSGFGFASGGGTWWTGAVNRNA